MSTLDVDINRWYSTQKLLFLFNFSSNFREIVAKEELEEAESFDGEKRFLGKIKKSQRNVCNFLNPICNQVS